MLGAGGMINVQSDLLPALRQVESFATNQVPFATALAATTTAKQVLAAERDEMRAVFDRPTPFSLNAFQVTPATKDNPVAVVEQKAGFGVAAGSHPRHWFDPQVEGGPRAVKAFESLLRRAGILPAGMFAVPGNGATLDQYGNITGAVIRKILSDVAASRDASQNATARSRKRVKRERYAVVGPKGAPIGISLGTGRTAKLVVRFVRQPMYAKRFDFFGVAERIVNERFAANFESALRRAMATAR